MCIGGLLSFSQLLPSLDNLNYGIVSDINRAVPFIAVAGAFFPWHNPPDWAVPKDCCLFLVLSEQRITVVITAFLILFILISSIYRKPAVLFFLVSSFMGLSYIFAFKYPGSLRHHGLILIIVLFSLWIREYYDDSQKKRSGIQLSIDFTKFSIMLINACLALSLLYSLKIQYIEYKYIFSGAKKMADFIAANRLDHSIIVAHRSVGSASLLPYLPGKQFWYADTESYGTFVIYNKKHLACRYISNDETISRAEKTFPNKSNLLLLVTKPLDFSKSHGFKLLYKVDKDIFGYGPELFYLYKSFEQNL
jgi:hypothetical protein